MAAEVSSSAACTGTAGVTLARLVTGRAAGDMILLFAAFLASLEAGLAFLPRVGARPMALGRGMGIEKYLVSACTRVLRFCGAIVGAAESARKWGRALGHRQVGTAAESWARGAGLGPHLGQGWAVPPHACGASQRRPDLTPRYKQAVGGQAVSAVDLGLWWTGAGAAGLIRRGRTARRRRGRREELHGPAQHSLLATTGDRAQLSLE